MSKINVFVVGRATHYAQIINNFKLVKSVEEADVVIFTGGADVTPAIYDESRHSTTYSDRERDNQEIKLFNRAKELDKLILGICRGSQFVTVMSGGKLVQHVTGHIGEHDIITNEGQTIRVSSTHHQMMYPYTANHEIIAVSKSVLSDQWWKNDTEQYEMMEEPEIVYYPDTKSLAVQGHPEHMLGSRFHKYVSELVIKYLNNE